MDEEKFCPLKQNANDVKCDKEKCAWWDVAYEACSLTNISFFLGEITNSLERRNRS